jgi:hypothetical protein
LTFPAGSRNRGDEDHSPAAGPLLAQPEQRVRALLGLHRIQESGFQENELAKPNYRHAKKQKEAARKARQDAKQQRRSNAPEATHAPASDAPRGVDAPQGTDAPQVPPAPVPAKPIA